MKYKTIGAFKNLQNVGYCRASDDMKVGMGVILDRAARTASIPATADEAKSCTRIVSNIWDKPEMRNYTQSGVVPAGDFVRADDLTSVANMEIVFAADEISTQMSQLQSGDTLIFGTDGLLEKSASVDGYRVYFEVIEKNAYMGGGILAVIRVAPVEVQVVQTVTDP